MTKRNPVLTLSDLNIAGLAILRLDEFETQRQEYEKKVNEQRRILAQIFHDTLAQILNNNDSKNRSHTHWLAPEIYTNLTLIGIKSGLIKEESNSPLDHFDESQYFLARDNRPDEIISPTRINLLELYIQTPETPKVALGLQTYRYLHPQMPNYLSTKSSWPY